MEKSYQNFMFSAKRGHPPSCHMIGQLAESGIGCKLNNKLALQMYNKAASSGYQKSVCRLGIAEWRGELDLRPDITNAIKWLKRGASGIRLLI